MSFPDIITVENSKQIEDDIWQPLKRTLEKAIEDVKEMRRKEGFEIKNDLIARVESINTIVKNIEKASKNKSKEDYLKLKERIQTIAKTDVIDEGRLEMEVALLAEKLDVTEECIRFKSHNTLFLDLLENGESEGRKLNFLLQEMHREANTIGAKSNHAQISHWVVEIKEEVEKLREQIQNIE